MQPSIHLENKSGDTFLLIAVATAALGGLLFGFDIAIITGAGPYLKRHFALDELQLGWAFSSLLFGCVVGSAFAGRLADRFGRKRVLLVVALLFAVTCLLTGLAPNFAAFILVRSLAGIAVGGVSILSPIYIAEMSPPERRGRLGAVYQLSIVIGILLSYLINYALRNSGPDSWRWMFITGVAPAAFFFALLTRVPETPRYLVMSGRQREARSVLARILHPESVEPALESISLSFANRRRRWADLLQPGIRRVIVVSCCLAILIHVSGVNTVIDYAPIIFQSAGWKIDAALFATFLVGVTNFIFTLASFAMIDRWGRKPLYIVGSLAMAGTLAWLSFLSLTGGFRGALVPALVMIYLAFFASCIGPVFWTLIPEIFPNDLRGTAMSAPVLTQWVANAVVVLLFPLAFVWLGKPATFGFLAAMSLVQAVFTWFWVPETKNKTLEEIETFWIRQ